VPDPEAVEGVRLAFRLYASGNYSDRDIARLLNAEGFPPSEASRTGRWTVGAVRRMLASRYYLGEVGHRDEWFPGKHEPILDPELLDRVQRARAQGPGLPAAPGREVLALRPGAPRGQRDRAAQPEAPELLSRAL
jgi:hypothetical protein